MESCQSGTIVQGLSPYLLHRYPLSVVFAWNHMATLLYVVLDAGAMCHALTKLGSVSDMMVEGECKNPL